MDKFFSLVLFLPIVFILVICLACAQYYQDASTELQEIMLRDAANSANDAAMFLAKSTANINIYGRVDIDPEMVWEEYKRTFLRSMNLHSERNMKLLEGYCPATILAVNDGYFIRMRTMVTIDGPEPNRTPEFRWSQKIPYARVVGSTYAADTMNGTNIYGYNSGPVVFGDGTPETDVAGGIHDTAAIAGELVRAMDYCVELENASVTRGFWDDKRFYVPAELLDTMYYDAVSFKGMSLLNLIQGFDLLRGKAIDYFTISNTQLVEANRLACYSDGGIKYYRPADALESHYSAEYFVPTKDQAARLGFAPDPRFYQFLHSP